MVFRINILRGTMVVVFGLLVLLLGLLCPTSDARAALIADLSLSLSESYNDNIFFSPTEQKSDFVTTISPIFNLNYTSKNVVLGLGYRGSARNYSKNSRESGYFQYLSVNMDFPILNRQIKGVKVTVTEQLSFSPELPGFTFSEADTDANDVSRRSSGLSNIRRANIAGGFNQATAQGVQLRKRDSIQNRAGIALSYAWTKRLSVKSSYSNIFTRYTAENTPDRVIHLTSYGMGYDFPLSPRSNWISSYGLALTTGDARNRLIYRVSTGLNHQFTKLTSGRLKVGGSYLEQSSPRVTGSARLKTRFRAGELSLRYVSRVAAGLSVIRSVTQAQSLSVQAKKNWSKRFSSFAKVGYSKNKSISGNEVDLTSASAAAGISLQVLEWLSSSIQYSYLKQGSAGSLGEGGERNTIWFYLTGVGSRWRIFK